MLEKDQLQFLCVNGLYKHTRWPWLSTGLIMHGKISQAVISSLVQIFLYLTGLRLLSARKFRSRNLLLSNFDVSGTMNVGNPSL